MSSPHKRVLCIGINPSKRDTEGTRHAGPSEQIQQRMNNQIQEAAVAGHDLQVELIGPDEMDVKIDGLVRELLASKTWDGFIVGGGIRKDVALTKYFERLVDAGRAICPQTRIGFKTSPMDIVKTVERMFREIVTAV